MIPKLFHEKIAGRAAALVLTAAITAVSCPADPASILAASGSGGGAAAFLPEIGKDSLPNVILDMPAAEEAPDLHVRAKLYQGDTLAFDGELDGHLLWCGDNDRAVFYLPGFDVGTRHILPSDYTAGDSVYTPVFQVGSYAFTVETDSGYGIRVKAADFSRDPGRGTAATGADLEKTDESQEAPSEADFAFSDDNTSSSPVFSGTGSRITDSRVDPEYFDALVYLAGTEGKTYEIWESDEANALLTQGITAGEEPESLGLLRMDEAYEIRKNGEVLAGLCFTGEGEPELISPADGITLAENDDGSYTVSDGEDTEPLVNDLLPGIFRAAKRVMAANPATEGSLAKATDADLKASSGSLAKARRMAPFKTAAVTSGVYIRSLSTQLFYGASKDSSGNYTWTVPSAYSDSSYLPGHRFAFRINFSTSGVGSAAAGEIKLTIPKSILTDRDGKAADETEFSIPAKDEVEDAGGNIDTSEIDDDVNYMWYEDEDSIVITNFRKVPAGDDGYIEAAYSTTKSSFSYMDSAAQGPFTCTMTAGGEEKSADPITVSLDTTAKITSTVKRYPVGGRIKEWNTSWGNAVKPADPGKYYYLVWDIASYVDATQPYTFTIDDSMESNYDGMEVLGYHFSGKGGFQAENSVSGETQRGTRYDQVLTAVPLDTYQDKTYWEAKNTETATVTPEDLNDDTSSQSAKQSWSWSKPVFHEPSGRFNAYKRGDGAYRAYVDNGYSIWSNTLHEAGSAGFNAGEFSRYDLEKFTGYNGEAKSLAEYGGFDFASWIVGYPYPWTVDGDAGDPASYGKKNVKFELVDDGVYLLDGDAALLSDDASANRTIENGGIDGAKAIRLTADDFKITGISYSWLMRDAEWDSAETGEYQEKDPAYTSQDVLTFYGKFGGSDAWTLIGSYNIKDGTESHDATYVSAMTASHITIADGQSMTAYKVEAENAHYYTEVFTVPAMTLKNSENVLALLDGKTTMLLVNNNAGHFYNQGADGSWSVIADAYHSDTDYAEVAEKNSSLTKKVGSTSNNTKRKYYTVTWQLTEKETVKSGKNGNLSYIPQAGGTFYDLLPIGSTFAADSVQVRKDGKIVLPESSYTVQATENYKRSGRTLVVIKISEDADYYTVSFDTRHSWNSIKDFGKEVYNPCAYMTGNDSITKGFPDNGGVKNADGTENTGAIHAARLMANLTDDTADDAGVQKFLFAENQWNILALTSASSGLTKKVKAGEDSAYTTSTRTHIGGAYSYELRYMNSYTSAAKGIILFDSLENYSATGTADALAVGDSDWHGTLTGVDISQLEKAGASPVVYISTKEGLSIDQAHDLSDQSVWEKLDDISDEAVLKTARAVAIDVSREPDGSEFVLGKGASIAAYLYMEAPEAAPDARDGKSYPYAYNNVYCENTAFDPDNPDDPGTSFLIHQDYTKIKLTVTGDLSLHKTSAKDGRGITGIAFRLRGTSDYGTAVDLERKTGAAGNITFKNLEKGSYILQETDATNDYLLDTTEYTVTIDATGKTLVNGKALDGTLEIANKPRVHADIRFFKVDSVFTAEKLAGAVYRLAGRSDYGTDVLTTATSGNGADGYSLGETVFSNIEKGTYTLKEIKAPEDHSLDDTEYTVKVDENGNVLMLQSGMAQKQIGSPKYSHTSNISDDGTQTGDCSAPLMNFYLAGSDRDGISMNAHVITIPGASKLHVKIVYALGVSAPTFDGIVMWAGSHPDYTMRESSSSLTGILNGTGTKEYDVQGDSVTFSIKTAARNPVVLTTGGIAPQFSARMYWF